jgi:16S rRNA (cytidine1402-2'-O)-methyltransferase
VETLRTAAWIACEDTRHSAVLLREYGVERKELISFHEHNEARRTAELIERLAQGEDGCLITDAGMPCVSDPGFRLVRACMERGLPHTVVPGPSAVITALVGSGLPVDRFFFGGFLPVKSGGRERELVGALNRDCTTLFFESPHRLIKSLAVCAAHAPDREMCVARELTKTFEEYRRGTAQVLLTHFTQKTVKGEIVLLISPLPKGGTQTHLLEHADDDGDGDSEPDNCEGNIPSE